MTDLEQRVVELQAALAAKDAELAAEKQKREELEILVAEAYIITGCLADAAGALDDDQVIAALDNFSGEPHKEVIPFEVTKLRQD